MVLLVESLSEGWHRNGPGMLLRVTHSLHYVRQFTFCTRREMFNPAAPTRLDFHFSALGIPVRVSPWFWVLSALLGRMELQQDPFHFASWMAVVFISILVHELGHALTARLFGYSPRIVLHQFGGIALFVPDRGYTTSRAILITAAGPAAGLALGSIALVVGLVLSLQGVDIPERWDRMIFQLVLVNFFWGFLNLLPVLPLDGGQLTREVLVHLSPRQGIRWTLIVSLITAGGIALLSLSLLQDLYLALMFGLMAFMNFAELQRRGGS